MNNFSTDILVIGGGGAGLMAAITARKAGKSVILVSKLRPGAGTCTAMSAAFFSNSGKFRSKEDHRADTLKVGQGLNDSSLVDYFIDNAETDVASLIDMGVALKEAALGYYGKEAVSPMHRGPAILESMVNYARDLGVQFQFPYFIWELIVKEGQVMGAWGYNRETEEPVVFLASAVILATGGGGAVYAFNDNPNSICGDGYALAARAGLGLIDMEFVQFFPLTTAYNEGRKGLFLAPQLVEIGTLVNEAGEDIVKKHSIRHPLIIKSRDHLSRMMMLEGKIYLDFTNVTEEDWEKAAKDFDYEGTMQVKKWLDSSLLKDSKKIPISPAAHFFVGGIEVNERMETNLPGLYAAGEVTGGLHGANRLGGNALSETIVFGKQAALSAASTPGMNMFFALQYIRLLDDVTTEYRRVEKEFSTGEHKPFEIMQRLTKLMWDNVGILRNKEGLNQALKQIQEMNNLSLCKEDGGITKALELKNMLLTCEMICRAALFREESRGCHYRIDFPVKDDNKWLNHSYLELNENEILLSKIPVK